MEAKKVWNVNRIVEHVIEYIDNLRLNFQNKQTSCELLPARDQWNTVYYVLTGLVAVLDLDPQVKMNKEILNSIHVFFSGMR